MVGGAAERSSGAFVLCKIRHNVSLSPCHIGDPRVGIEQELTAQLMQYSEALQGVVLAFHKVALEKPAGHIINEMPYIHCKVLADALVFRPRVGMRLQGTVNKIGSNHIGMLFAGVFNGSVAAAEIPAGFVHNYHQDCWLDADGTSIAVNDTVDVKVVKVHVAGGMVAIEATMRFKGAKVSTASTLQRSLKTTFAAEEEEEEEEEPIVVAEKKKKKKKAKKTVVVKEEVVEEQLVVVADTKKKSKKRKQVEVAKEEPAEEQEVVKKEKKSKHKDKDEKKHKKKKSKAE